MNERASTSFPNVVVEYRNNYYQSIRVFKDCYIDSKGNRYIVYKGKRYFV